MNYQWDHDKARSNLRKHGIEFADAVSVFADERALTIDNDHPEQERFVTLGMDSFGRVLVVVYAYRGDTIRMISARKATPHERIQYQEVNL